MNRIRAWILLLLAALALGAFVAGCTPETVDDDGSDLPWATPEDWEGGPPIGPMS